jgi:hypothetical protein
MHSAEADAAPRPPTTLAFRNGCDAVGHHAVADAATAVAREFVKFILCQFEKVHRALNGGWAIKTDRLEHRVSERDVEGSARV